MIAIMFLYTLATIFIYGAELNQTLDERRKEFRGRGLSGP
jgi:uncharacterized BrkB/YihY/UPF0761 family membrane protein